MPDDASPWSKEAAAGFQEAALNLVNNLHGPEVQSKCEKFLEMLSERIASAAHALQQIAKGGANGKHWSDGHTGDVMTMFKSTLKRVSIKQIAAQRTQVETVLTYSYASCLRYCQPSLL